jgi:histidinol-phosphatase (PHP family)
MPFSHHSHSGQFCAHATGTLEEMVQTAIARGMKLFALTEHMQRGVEDFYPEEVYFFSCSVVGGFPDAFRLTYTQLRKA